MRTPAAILSLALLTACGGEKAPEESREVSVNEVASQLAAVQIEPGLWEARSEVVNVTGEGLPREVQSQMKGRASEIRNCITPEQAARPDANFLTAQQNSNCTYRGFSMQNGRVEGAMTCTGGDLPGEMTTEMSGEYGPRSYDMRMRMTTTGMPGGADMTIETRVSGRRVGDCPEGGAGS